MKPLNKMIKNGDLRGDYYTDGFRVMDGLLRNEPKKRQ